MNYYLCHVSIIKDTKFLIANYLLKKELQSNNRQLKAHQFNFDNIKTVGILFDSSNAEDYEIVKRYVLYLREHKKRVKAIGFFNTKNLPPMTYSKLEYDFFSAREITAFGYF